MQWGTRDWHQRLSVSGTTEPQENLFQPFGTACAIRTWQHEAGAQIEFHFGQANADTTNPPLILAVR